MLAFEPARLASSHTPRLIFYIAVSSTPLDQKLSQVKAYLERCLESREMPLFLANIPQLTIDLGILGTRDYAAAPASLPDWPGGPVYPIRLERSQVLFGPLYLPDQAASACPHCLERRWFGRRRKEVQLAFLSAQAGPVTSGAASLTGFALEAIWQTFAALLHILSTKRFSDDFPQNCTVLDLLSGETSQYHLIKDSACPVCATS